MRVMMAGPTRTPATDGANRSEVLAALSLAIDLGLGQPMEHMLRSSLIAARLADRLGLDERQRAVVYHANLVAWIGCHADSHELAALFGDDLAFRSDSYQVDWKGLPFLNLLVSHVARDRPVLERGRRRLSLLAGVRSRVRELIQSHCMSAAALADRVGLDEDVRTALQFAFERWDGGGLPAAVRGAAIPLEMRVVHLADVAEVHLRRSGVSETIRMARARSGTQFDPAVVAAFEASAGEIGDGLPEDNVWQAALDLAPDRDRVVAGAELDELLAAVGAFVDLKCPFMAGHSSAVAALAARAGRCYGLSEGEASLLRRAGLVHDLGRMGVPNSVWEKDWPLSDGDWERVRLYPYLTGRILCRVAGLEEVAAIACAHHERLDGSGYPRGLSGTTLTPAQRILAAADVYQALREPRPHRPAYLAGDAARLLRLEARQCRLEARAVEAVLEAAGHRVLQRRRWPAGLTTREVDVLQMIARGCPNRLIAATLHITEKTVRNHVQNIYAKVGVGNRTGAALFALRHGLVGELPEPATVPGHPEAGLER